MLGTKAVFGLLALLLVAVHFADAQAEGGRKCKKVERYRSVGNNQCRQAPTPWKTEIEKDEYRIDCRCRRGLFVRVRECIKCIYEVSTTTTEQPATEVSGDVTSVNPVTSPATVVPSTSEVPTAPNPGTSQVPVNPSTTDAPVIITSENPAPTVPATQVPSEVPSFPTEISVDTTVAF